MKLQEQQEIWEDIYNNPENYFKFKNDLKYKYKTLSNSSVGKKYKDSNVLEIIQPWTSYKALSIANIGNKIYIVPDKFYDIVSDLNPSRARELSKEKRERNKKPRELLFSIVRSVFLNKLNPQYFPYSFMSDFIFKKPNFQKKDNNILTSLQKQQFLIENVIKNFYYKELDELIGKENVIKLINNELPADEIESIIDKYKPFQYAKVDKLHEYIVEQLDKNKNLDPDKVVPDKFYNLSLFSLKPQKSKGNEMIGEIYVTKIYFKKDKIYYASGSFETSLNKNGPFTGIKDNGNEFYVQVNSKKDLFDILKEKKLFNKTDLPGAFFNRKKFNCQEEYE